jgi:serine/threonine-protein kinase
VTLNAVGDGHPLWPTTPNSLPEELRKLQPAHDPAARFVPGTLLNERYRIVALLGRGGMGEVYRADDLKLGQPVALKFLPEMLARDAEARAHFYAEVRLGRQVSHPNVCRLYDLVEIEGHHCLSMEYVDGEDLATLLRRIGHLPADKAVGFARDVLAGLAAAHDKGVIHRDLKPANIMLDGKGRACITDFGIAMLAGDARAGFAGTPLYMAPEQLDGAPASVHSDLYAFGLVLYEALTGRRAFAGESMDALKAQRTHDEPPRLPDTVRDVAPVVEDIVRRCLAPNPQQRPSSAAAVLSILSGLDATTPLRSVPRRRWTDALRPWITIAIIALGLAAAVSYFSAPRRDETTAALGPASTAVLPFVNMSGDKGNEYFSDGMTETLLDRLAQVPQLKVAARTSSFSFKGKNTDVRRIAAQLGVASIVEGSVQQAGDMLRITAQLVRAADGAHLWSKHFDRKASDLFAIQDEIAGSVTEALVGELLPQTKEILAKGGTKDLSAYDAYVRGLGQAATNSIASLRQAEASLQQALMRDPNYVDAMIAQIDVWYRLFRTGALTAQEYSRLAVPMLDRVQALDADNAPALGFRGELANDRGEHALAVQLLQKAVTVAPGVARLHFVLGNVYRDQGDAQAWLAETEKAAALDPRDASVELARGAALTTLKRFDEAERSATRALQLDARNPDVAGDLAWLAMSRGDYVGAVIWNRKAFALDPNDPDLAGWMTLRLQMLGETKAADAWLAETFRLRPGGFVPEAIALSLHAERGELAEALASALRLVARKQDDHNGMWAEAMDTGCLAANELGRLAEMRAALVQAGATPAELTPAPFAAWAGASSSASARLSDLMDLRRCLYTGAEKARREQVIALLENILGKDWDSREPYRGYAPALRQDRQAIVAQVLPATKQAVGWLWYEEATARMLDYADVPQIAAVLAARRSALAQQRAALPAALAKEGLSMLPPGHAEKADAH